MDSRTAHECERRARFEALVAEVGDPLARYLGRRAAEDDAHEVWAESLLVLWRRLDDVPADAALPWAYGVARHCLANQRRSRERRLSLVRRIGAQRLPVAGLDGRPSPGGNDDGSLLAALQRLSDAEQELLRLSAWEDLAPAEISVVLGLTPNAVSIRLHRARAHLRAELERSGDVRKTEPPSEHKSSGHHGRETA